ncbi:MAG: hypothetical protein HRU09_10550 [Oligoflexales bacterium]|nr:hypothetical protein [Oligoflexales bacterium]
MKFAQKFTHSFLLASFVFSSPLTSLAADTEEQGDIESPADLVDINLEEGSAEAENTETDQEQPDAQQKSVKTNGKWKKRALFALGGVAALSGGTTAGVLLAKSLSKGGAANDSNLDNAPTVSPYGAKAYSLKGNPDLDPSPAGPYFGEEFSIKPTSSVEPTTIPMQVVDLSKELNIASKSVTQKLINIIDENAEAFKHVRGIVILQDGEIIGEHYIKGRM